MDNDFVIGIIGVIGTLLGTVLGWALNSISRLGKLKIYPDWEEHYYKPDEYGGSVECKNREDFKYYNYRISLEIYNTSNDPLIMRDFRVLFRNHNGVILTSVPKDYDTRRLSGGMQIYDDVLPLTIPQKSIIKVKLCGGFYQKDELSKLLTTNEVVFNYRDKKNKGKELLIIKK